MNTNCISVVGLAWTSSNYWVPGLPWSLTVFPFYGSLVHYLYPLHGQSWVPTVFEYLTSLCVLTVFQYTTSPVHLLWLVLMCSYASTVFSTWFFMSSDCVWMPHQSCALTVFEYSTRCEHWLYSVLGQSWATAVLEYSTRCEQWLCLNATSVFVHWLSLNSQSGVSCDCLSLLGQSWVLTVFHFLASHEPLLCWILNQSWALTVFTTWPVMSTNCLSLLGQSWALTVFHYLTNHEHQLCSTVNQLWARTVYTTWSVISTDCIQDLVNLELQLCSCMCPVLSNCYVHSSISLEHWLYLIL